MCFTRKKHQLRKWNFGSFVIERTTSSRLIEAYLEPLLTTKKSVGNFFSTRTAESSVRGVCDFWILNIILFLNEPPLKHCTTQINFMQKHSLNVALGYRVMHIFLSNYCILLLEKQNATSWCCINFISTEAWMLYWFIVPRGNKTDMMLR